MNEWISVKDRLPEVGVPVLVHEGPYNYQVIATINSDGRWEDTVEGYMAIHVTHWMPLPDPPTDTE